MRLVEQVPEVPGTSASSDATACSNDWADHWADHTRAVLTRDLLVRARHARPGEARALEFRALHLNLSLVGEVVAGLTGQGRLEALSDAERGAVEHAALDGLHEAVRLFDPYGDLDFAAFAAPRIERQVAGRLSRVATLRGSRPLRLAVHLAVHRVALAIAGARV